MTPKLDILSRLSFAFSLCQGFVALLTTGLLASTACADTIALSALDLSKAQQGFGKPMANRSVGGKPLSIAGQVFPNGFGTHASGMLWLDLKKSATRFSAYVGVDDEVAPRSGSVEFLVYGDSRILWRSGVMKTGDAAMHLAVDVTGIEKLVLQVTDAGDGMNFDHADWADAVLTFGQDSPNIVVFPHSEAIVLTPPAKATPRINGAKIFGVRPGAPFIYSVAATGMRPMRFSARGLPKGLQLDARTGRISGRLSREGTYHVILRAQNARGRVQRPFKIVVGDQIQLTPPLGWNSWNCWGPRVDQEKVLRSARALVAAGLDQHGWSYINIDDAWQGARGGPFNAIQPNAKFPDMRGLVVQIHSLGLKAGIYSSPWMTTYAHHVGGSSDSSVGAWDSFKEPPQAIGAYHFATADAQQWAAWGIDYLKYDWNPVKLEPTKEMHDALRATGRDIVLSLSNNSGHNLESRIAEVSPHAELWRTTEDIFDNWGGMSRIGFSQNGWTSVQKPGHFNDPDMLIVGNLFGWQGAPHPTGLTPDEQYTHISLWSLLGAPLLIGCDLETLDSFTLGLLTNDEVIDIDQDSLAHHGVRVSDGGSGANGQIDVYAKPLEDGSVAVGLFNRDLFSHPVSATWSALGLTGRCVVRDVWRQRDVGTFSDRFEAAVAPHGVMLLRISSTKSW